MNMHCNQCQETYRNSGCVDKGVCGKDIDLSFMQDSLIAIIKQISVVCMNIGKADLETGRYVVDSLFSTITNANFDKKRFSSIISEGVLRLNALKKKNVHYKVNWPSSSNPRSKIPSPVLIQKTRMATLQNEDIKSLKELLIYSCKGMSAYVHHAARLGSENANVCYKIMSYLAATSKNLCVDEMIAKVLESGETAVAVMKMLDLAHTNAFGKPEITEVNLSVRNNPGILISGHDLQDLDELLKQTEDTGVDVYTHCEMLPGHYYPKLKKYKHLVGHYGGAWHQQKKDFLMFNGPVLMTTNCLMKPEKGYRDRLFTTGTTGFPEIKYITDSQKGTQKDFSEMIGLAKICKPPTGIEAGSLVGGFGHHQVISIADKVVDSVKSGAIKRFVVMAGCDGRHKSRNYYTEVAENLPKDAVILTAGCAKFRYNKINHGNIDGIPRLLDAGQCNDCYSLAVIALKLKDILELEDINDLPISFDIGWFEQKAAAILLALLHLGFKGIRLGPTLPAFLSPGVINILKENFDIKTIGQPKKDVELMMQGL